MGTGLLFQLSLFCFFPAVFLLVEKLVVSVPLFCCFNIPSVDTLPCHILMLYCIDLHRVTITFMVIKYISVDFFFQSYLYYNQHLSIHSETEWLIDVGVKQCFPWNTRKFYNSSPIEAYSSCCCKQKTTSAVLFCPSSFLVCSFLAMFH